MKVILQRDVKGVGREHEAVEAKDGYALNFLIPKKLAVPATPAALKDAEFRMRQKSERKELDHKLLSETLATLADGRVQIAKKANTQGHLYDAVDAADIASAVKSATNLDVPEEAIKLEKPIKELGAFRVPVSAGEVFGELPITIIPE